MTLLAIIRLLTSTFSATLSSVCQRHSHAALQLGIQGIHPARKGYNEPIGLDVAQVSRECEGVHCVLHVVAHMTEIVGVRLKQRMSEGEVHERASGLVRDDLLADDAKAVLVVCMQGVPKGVFNRIPAEVDLSTCIDLIVVVRDRVPCSDVRSGKVFPL